MRRVIKHLGAGLMVCASLHSAEPVTKALETITTNDLMKHITVLSSDEFEGRAPGTPGEERTVKYLVEQFKSIGLEPGNPDGTYLQGVPLVGFRATPTISLKAEGADISATFPGDFVAWSRHVQPGVKVRESDIVFVGYGIVAPEYGWDDFKDVDVRGKIILMLVNDPPLPDRSDPAKLDENLFRGKAMTYYGRWTYKYEIASAKGAAAALIIHETGPAGYPWEVIMGSNSRENMELQTPDRNTNRVPVEGWITTELAEKVLAASGENLAALKAAALTREFRPRTLRVKASLQVQSQLREFSSRNVVAKVPGTDAKLKDEYVIYTAHWDHLGRDEKLQGDQIYNGAVDNASGTAALLEIAQAFKEAKPKRSIVFLSVTAEEKGLLGAKHYVTKPLYPLERTVANINMDGLNLWGRTRDIGLVGVGQSTLEDVLERIVTRRGRKVVPEAEPEKGYYFRSDHFEFARVGVPGLYTDEGIDFIGKPPGYGMQKREEYVAQDYHKVSDEIKPGWDLLGAVDDVGHLFEVGFAVADAPQRPEWKAGSEFRDKRKR